MNAMIVHDMKNLLNVVIHMGQSDMAVYAGKSMLNMVNNILDIEKFESTSIKLNKELVKSEQLVHDAIKEIEYSMQMKNISISNKSEENCHIQVDRNLINRVIVNLLTNAIKFSPEKSTITIKANCTEKLYTLSIQDEGEGIETSQLNKIFEKYYQANAKDYDSVRSTGLGLSFSKMAVEAHKGSIRAESVFGKGAKFIVELPLS
jgi:signal transduction histidine kinase